MVFAHTTPWKWLYFFLKGLNRPENLTEKKYSFSKIFYSPFDLTHSQRGSESKHDKSTNISWVLFFES